MSSETPTSPTSPLPDTTSPLTKVDPKSLQVLFNEDPEGLTEEECERICEALRADRARFNAEPQPRPKKVAAANLKKKVDANPTLSLDDLGDL